MTEEEIKALQEAREAAERRAAEAEAMALAAKEEAEKAKLSINNIVEELKAERQKKQEALEKANITNPQSVDVNALVEQALAKKEQERIQKELEEAILEFKGSKPEFQSDTAGLVFSKFQSELSKFNLSGIKSKDEAKKRLEEVYRFVNLKESQGGSDSYEGTPANGYPAPIRGQQTPKEVDNALEMARISKDKFAEMKTKYPEALSGLGITD